MGGAGGNGAGGNGAGGFMIGPPPPFSIPPAPAAGTLTPCDSMAAPEVLALLAEGRALVTQQISDQRLVRLWTVATNTLETLFTTSASFSWDEERLSVSDDSRYVFEIVPRSGEATAVRVFDLTTRQFAADPPLEIAVAAVSSNGRAILDRSLRRFTREGKPDFDFAPLIARAFPAATGWRAEGLALSPTGNTLAVATRVSPDSAPSVVVARQDGRLVTLSDGPDLWACSRGKLSFSSDERFLLAFACGTVRVWDLDAATAVVNRSTAGLIAATFTKTGSRLVTTDADGVIERDLDGANPFVWDVDGQQRFVVAPESLFGHRGRALVILTRGQVVGTWRHPNQTWERAVAVSDDAAFTLVDDWDAAPFPMHFAPMLARFAVNRAGPTATLSTTNERQSEWGGLIAPSPDGRRLAVAFPDSVRIVDSGTLARLASLPIEAGAIAWSPDGRYLATTPSIHYRDPGRPFYRPTKSVDLWEANSGVLVARFPTEIYPHGIAFDDVGRSIRGWGSALTVAPGSDAAVTQFVPEGEPVSFKVDLPTGTVSPTRDAPFVGSARDLVAEEGGTFRVSTGDALATFGDVRPRRAVFSGDLSLVFVMSDWQGRLFAVGDGHMVTEIQSDVFRPLPLALSHDGRRLVIDQGIFCLGR